MDVKTFTLSESLPDKVRSRLTEQQLETLKHLNERGLVLADVRLPLFQAPALIVKLLPDKRYGIILKDGSVHLLEVGFDEAYSCMSS